MPDSDVAVILKGPNQLGWVLMGNKPAENPQFKAPELLLEPQFPIQFPGPIEVFFILILKLLKGNVP